jgi:multicomponent Na+:H+ antiporter subunit B
MNSLILRTLAPVITLLMIAFSVFVTLRGHNSPGGGFTGGLLAASGVALYALAFGVEAARRMLRLHPLTIAAAGLIISALSGMASALYGVPYMTGLWFDIGIPVSTVMSFDIGVYLVVVGAFSSILLTLEEGEDE